MKKRGPKPKINSRKYRAFVFLSLAEIEQVRKSAAQEGVGISEYIRRRITGPKTIGLLENLLDEPGKEFLALARAEGWEGFRSSAGWAAAGGKEGKEQIDEASWPYVRLVEKADGQESGENLRKQMVTMDPYKEPVRRGKVTIEEAVNWTGGDLRKILSIGMFEVARKTKEED